MSDRTLRLAVVSTHPIQYYAPLFRALAAEAGISLRVFFTWSQAEGGATFDPEFGRTVSWDVPLLDGYAYEFVNNRARRPGTHHFFGVDNPRLVTALSDWAPDAILVFGWNLRSHLRVMRRFKGRIPVLFRGDSTLLDPRPAHRRLARRVALTWIFRHVDAAIAVGEANRRYFLWAGVRPERIFFAPHAIDNDRFADPGGEAARDALARRTALGIPDDAVTFLFAAKFIAKKAPLMLVDAFASLPGDPHLVMVGDGPLDSPIREAADRHPRIHVLPMQNQGAMPAVYRIGDTFVLPSQGPGETWGLALNEAMACARPVIGSSRAGGAGDLIRPGVDGWIFESADRSSLRASLSNALARGRPGLRRMGHDAAERIRGWSIDRAAAGIAVAVRRCHGNETEPR
ncbi:MAG: glycosyltransferase family 4 protein [Gammaproteobacteria bacterium]|nr:glycosyltransferase family 4 protein [Gammaproteobacteria bacterium]